MSSGEQGKRELLAHHREHLRQSGLTDATIETAGIYSVIDAGEAARLLNWNGGGGPAPAIALPNLSPAGAGRFTILRPDEPFRRNDGSAPKYETPLGSEPRPYFPPAGLVSPNAWTNPGVPLLAVEGIKKALAAAQVGPAAISAQGVNVWHDVPAKDKTGLYRLHRDLTALPLSGRDVFVAFDGGDTTNNPHVILAEARLAQMLLN